MRVCTKCHAEKDDAEYVIGKTTRGACRDCRLKQRKEMNERYDNNAATIKKTCKNCHEEKDGTHFRYTVGICKECQSVLESEANNRKTADSPPITCSVCNKEQPAINFRFRSKTCGECEKQRLYKWREENPDKFKEVCKRYREKAESKEKRNEYLRKVYEDSAVKVRTQYVNRIRALLKGSLTKPLGKGKVKYEALLGCEFTTLQKWLEYNFKEGMTWDNYGTYWHIDHTTPCASFDFANESNLRMCFHWSNLNPLEATENLKKSDKIDMAFIAIMRSRAIKFVTETDITMKMETLPEDIRAVVSIVLDTKVALKEATGSGEKPEVR